MDLHQQPQHSAVSATPELSPPLDIHFSPASENSSFGALTMPRPLGPHGLDPESNKILLTLRTTSYGPFTLEDVFVAFAANHYVYLDQKKWDDFMVREIPELRAIAERRFAEIEVTTGLLKGLRNWWNGIKVHWDIKSEYMEDFAQSQRQLEALGLMKREVHKPADGCSDDVLFSLTKRGEDLARHLSSPGSGTK
jgi:hypothetical protein